MAYDTNNVFARILRGELPCQKVFEDPYVLAFKDIHPQAPVHVLVIPKGAYETLDEFHARASNAEQAALMKAIGHVARLAGVDQAGYRVIVNCGGHGHQDVAHLHFHVLGGKALGKMLPGSA